MPRYRRGFDTQEAFAHLARRDRKLGKWMKRIGPIDPDAPWRRPFDPVEALAHALLYQQLNGKAAATIVGRVEQATGTERFHSDRSDEHTSELHPLMRIPHAFFFFKKK